MNYNQIYNKTDFFWGLEADWIVHHAIKDHLKKYSISNVLDLGCGEGRNSFEIAKNGFVVDAIDNSDVGIQKLDKYAIKNKLNINTKVYDAYEYFQKNTFLYDAIFCLNLLQSLEENIVKKIIPLMQENTSKGGYNIISCIIAENKIKKDKIISNGGFAFDESELKIYYQEWDILFYNEGYSSWRPHENKQKKWFIVEIIAKKK